ncbi:MAG: sarcosine oxidase subunit delta [Oceanospirillaceae bacterium]
MNRIPCPHCGERDLEEFYYGGDATVQRPSMDDGSLERWHDFVYLRDNPRGPHSELWYHSSGCRRWFKLTRDTLNHQILAADQKEPETVTGDNVGDSNV